MMQQAVAMEPTPYREIVAPKQKSHI